MEDKDKNTKSDFVVNNPNPPESIPPTEGTTIGGQIPKEVQNQNAGLPNAEEKNLKDKVAQETSANKTPGSQPSNVILPEVKERLARLAEESRKKMRDEGANVAEPVKHDTTVEDKPLKKEEAISGKVEVRNTTGNETVDKMEKQCQEILEEYGGLEGNIPVHSTYWGLRNAIRAELKKF